MVRSFLTPQKCQQQVLSRQLQKKTAEATGDVVANEIPDKITWATSSKSTMPPQTDEASTGRSREFIKFTEKRRQIIDRPILF